MYITGAPNRIWLLVVEGMLGSYIAMVNLKMGGVGLMQATCINEDITWSDVRVMSLSVNTALFKPLTDTLQPTQKLVVLTHLTRKWSKGTVYSL